MPDRISIKVFFRSLAFVLAVVLLSSLAGCSKRRAPDYDSRKGQALLDICNALADDKNAEASQAIEVFEQLSPGNDFAMEASLIVQRRLQSIRIQQFLDASDYDGLRTYLQSFQLSSTAGSELLSLNDLPDALQALTLFRAKMPWETSQSLKQALEELELRCDVLFQFPSWQRFLNMQLDDLARLKEKELAERIRQWLVQMQEAVATGDQKEFELTCERFRAEQPDHTFFAYLEQLLAGTEPSFRPRSMTPFFHLALAALWDVLPSGFRTSLATHNPPQEDSDSLAAHIVATRATASPKLFQSLFTELQERNLQPAPELIQDYLLALGLNRLELPASLRSPCPDFSSFSDFLQHITQQANQGTHP
ncbi:MAG: hypothetical protein IJJ26_02715 [Victivallales bacterium]|nr:hypothetical protein [Victivallales bacterium]